jgi:hypothetical protein
MGTSELDINSSTEFKEVINPMIHEHKDEEINFISRCAHWKMPGYIILVSLSEEDSGQVPWDRCSCLYQDSSQPL